MLIGISLIFMTPSNMSLAKQPIRKSLVALGSVNYTGKWRRLLVEAAKSGSPAGVRGDLAVGKEGQWLTTLPAG